MTQRSVALEVNENDLAQLLLLLQCADLQGLLLRRSAMLYEKLQPRNSQLDLARSDDIRDAIQKWELMRVTALQAVKS